MPRGGITSVALRYGVSICGITRRGQLSPTPIRAGVPSSRAIAPPTALSSIRSSRQACIAGRRARRACLGPKTSHSTPRHPTQNGPAFVPASGASRGGQRHASAEADWVAAVGIARRRRFHHMATPVTAIGKGINPPRNTSTLHTGPRLVAKCRACSRLTARSAGACACGSSM